MPTTFGCSLPSRGPMSSPEGLRSLAQAAENAGFDSVWVSDHIILPRQVESFYPYAPDGVATFRPDEPYYEPLAALNFLAGCTRAGPARHPRADSPLPATPCLPPRYSRRWTFSPAGGLSWARAWDGWKRSSRRWVWTPTGSAAR